MFLKSWPLLTELPLSSPAICQTGHPRVRLPASFLCVCEQDLGSLGSAPQGRWIVDRDIALGSQWGSIQIALYKQPRNGHVLRSLFHKQTRLSTRHRFLTRRQIEGSNDTYRTCDKPITDACKMCFHVSHSLIHSRPHWPSR
jgi:hypothetical protein